MGIHMFKGVGVRFVDFTPFSVILLPVHPASFAHNFVSAMQSLFFSKS